jgi:hypothetical protein
LGDVEYSRGVKITTCQELGSEDHKGSQVVRTEKRTWLGCPRCMSLPYSCKYLCPLVLRWKIGKGGLEKQSGFREKGQYTSVAKRE